MESYNEIVLQIKFRKEIQEKEKCLSIIVLSIAIYYQYLIINIIVKYKM